MDNIPLTTNRPTTATTTAATTTTTTTTTTTPPRLTLFKRRHLSTKSRIPLSNRSNLSKPTQQQERRPLGSQWDRRDSSEGLPSPHGSVPDATSVSESNSIVSNNGNTKSPLQASTPSTSPSARPVTPSEPCPTAIDPNSESPLSQIETFNTPFLYGHGTELAPIAEQRSRTTLRSGTTSGTVSTSDISSLLKHKESATSSIRSRRSRTESPPRRLRRRQSFSFDTHPLHITPATTNTSSDGQPGSSKSSRHPEICYATDNVGPSVGVSVGTSSSSSHSESGVRIPRLRNTTRRHSPPTVERVDIHAYPQQPGYPRREIRGPKHYADMHLTQAEREDYVLMERSLSRMSRSLQGNLGVLPIAPPPSCAAPVLRRRPRLLCKTCERPADQHWSLFSTLTGFGKGQRRGHNWCSRCAWRKVGHILCCCDQGCGAYSV
ncbi:hypothetical protein F5Y11DRAFT_346883 [Daldinia sp. FL1419]|nr:hypothetical protein F5Y11DRAFT_346883 [Daldinia sp. FL1419]